MGKKQIREINVVSTPNAGGRMSKPDHYRDSTREPVGKPKAEKVMEAKDRPGAALAAGKKQREDADGCDETMRNPCNTGGCK